MRGIKGVGVAMLLVFITSAAFTAQDSSVLLEKAIYTEEILGKLNDAIDIYKQIMNAADANRTIGATAIYRLGMCYRKSGNEAAALSTLSALAKAYPEQKDLIAKGLLLNLKPEPWADGEILRLTQKWIGSEGISGSGAYGTLSVESTQESGKPAWVYRYHFGTSRAPVYYAVTHMDAATMLPMTNRTVSNQTDLAVKYGADKIEVSNLKDSSQPLRLIPSTGTVYDAWTMALLLRRLPLKEGFQATVPLFESFSGSFTIAKFSVVARETITVPAGSFDCYKIVMTPDNNEPTDSIFWISTDSHAYLVKTYIQGLNDFELKSIDVVGKSPLVNLEAPELGIGLAIPRQWYLSFISQPSAFSASGAFVEVAGALMLAAPETNSSLNLTISPYKPELGPVEKLVERRIAAFLNLQPASQIRPYQVRPQTRESVVIGGIKGERFVADTRDLTTGEPIVEYVYYLASQTKLYSFTFQTEKDNFDAMMPVFESIVYNLRVQ